MSPNWDDYTYWGSQFPNSLELYANDGKWKINGTIVPLSALNDEQLRRILRLLDKNKRQRYFKFQELRAEAKKRKLPWAYKIFKYYVGYSIVYLLLF